MTQKRGVNNGVSGPATSPFPSTGCYRIWCWVSIASKTDEVTTVTLYSMLRKNWPSVCKQSHFGNSTGGQSSMYVKDKRDAKGLKLI